MTGWTRKKRVAFQKAFQDFLGECQINTKDHGLICLGDNLYRAQNMFFNTVFDGLEDDIHTFNALKSRQLGISSGTRALSVFWLGMHPGLTGACIFDTDLNKNNARREIEMMVADLPDSLGFPKVKSSNRQGLVLDNNSVLMFMNAGVRKNKGSGTLGRSLPLSFYHASEMVSWDNDEGWEALQHSLSEINPDRLYLRESTGKDFGFWHDVWTEDRKDPAHVRCVFLGWWSKDSQEIKNSNPDFERYGIAPPTDVETKRIKEVYERYEWQITPEQLAWIRRKMDPSVDHDEDADVDYVGNTGRLAEQAWVEDDSWQMSGSVFFAPQHLAEIVNKHVKTAPKPQYYMFTAGHEFIDMKVIKSPNAKLAELKVWEEPDPDGIYVVSCDPAYGSSDKNDRSAIQIMRCYADGLDQCAEYAWPLINTRQLAWALLALAGWYAGQTGTVYLILELNGPGSGVLDEINYLKTHLPSGYQPKEVSERGLDRLFHNVRNYIYSRQDSFSPGQSWFWKTSPGVGPAGKIRLMERLRDFVSNGMLHIRSLDTLEEMRTIARKEDTIEAQGHKKDDRVMGLALAVRCWEERVRKGMSVQKRTREFEIARKRHTVHDLINIYNKNQFEGYMSAKKAQRNREISAMRRARWRSR